jgi:hypothetical protein
MNDNVTPTPETATPAPQKENDTRHYKVKDRVTGDVIYVIASSRSQAKNFASYNRFDVTILTIKEALSIKGEDILDATVQPGPPKQLKLDVPAA